MGRLDGRVAIVTGAAKGIGLATARRFLSEGARVAAWDLEPGEALAQLQRDHPESARATGVDVRDAAAVRRAAADVLDREGRLDVLVNNAGITPGYLPTLQVTDGAWHAVIETNLTGALHCVQAVVPHMARARWGRIVNVSSVLAEYGTPGHTVYVATKAGLTGMTRVWAREFGPSGITVNAVRPGYIVTAMNAANPPQLVQQVVAHTPLGRLGQPDDVANVFLFLCSDEAGFITGAIIPVDGGLIA